MRKIIGRGKTALSAIAVVLGEHSAAKGAVAGAGALVAKYARREPRGIGAGLSNRDIGRVPQHAFRKILGEPGLMAPPSDNVLVKP